MSGMNPPPLTINEDKELDAWLYNLYIGQNLLSAGGGGLNSDPDTGIITDPDGNTIGYLYQYIHVKYADDNVGTNLSNSPASRLYYGIRNSADTTESTNPADYTWFEVAGGGFGATKELYFLVLGGRRIKFEVATTAPSYKWIQDPGTAIDMDNIVPATTVSTVEVLDSAITAAKTALAAIDPNSGDLSINSVTTNNIVAGAVTALKISVASLAAINADLGAITAGTITLNTSGGHIKSGQTAYNTGTGFWLGRDGSTTKFSIGNSSGNRMTWDGTDLNIVGELTVGSSPAISGTTMTGSGLKVYDDGRFVVGNSTTNITFNGSDAVLNGFQATTSTSFSATTIHTGSTVSTFTYSTEEITDGYLEFVANTPIQNVSFNGYIETQTDTATQRITKAVTNMQIYRETSPGTWTAVGSMGSFGVLQLDLTHPVVTNRRSFTPLTFACTIEIGSFVAGDTYRLALAGTVTCCLTTDINSSSANIDNVFLYGNYSQQEVTV